MSEAPSKSPQKERPKQHRPRRARVKKERVLNYCYFGVREDGSFFTTGV